MSDTREVSCACSTRPAPSSAHRPLVNNAGARQRMGDHQPCPWHPRTWLYALPPSRGGSLLCLEGFHRRSCDPRAGFCQAAVGPPDQAPPGQNRAKYHPPRRHPPSVPRPGARSAENVRRLGSSWAHTASIHRLRVLSGRRSSSTGAHHFDPGIVGKRRSGAEESIAIVPEFATGAGDRRHPAPARRPVPSNRVAQRADNEIYCARVLKVRIHFPPPERDAMGRAARMAISSLTSIDGVPRCLSRTI